MVTEIGIDMARFATPGHLLLSACMCRATMKVPAGAGAPGCAPAQWLKPTMVQAAWAAIKVKGSYLQAQFHRLRARRGAQKPIVAVAASMLTRVWHMLRDGAEWRDLGAAHFDRADAQESANRLIPGFSNGFRRTTHAALMNSSLILSFSMAPNGTLYA